MATGVAEDNIPGQLLMLFRLIDCNMMVEKRNVPFLLKERPFKIGFDSLHISLLTGII